MFTSAMYMYVCTHTYTHTHTHTHTHIHTHTHSAHYMYINLVTSMSPDQDVSKWRPSLYVSPQLVPSSAGQPGRGTYTYRVQVHTCIQESSMNGRISLSKINFLWYLG